MRNSSRCSLLSTFAAAALAATFVAGCGDDHDDEENPNVEACEHLQETSSVPITAAATAAGATAAHAIVDNHKRYEVTLSGAAGSRTGYVTFASAGAEYIFFTSEPVKLTVTNPNGGPVAADSSATSVPECTAVMGRHVYDLHAVGPHVIQIGPESTVEKVSFVVEAGSHTH